MTNHLLAILLLVLAVSLLTFAQSNLPRANHGRGEIAAGLTTLCAQDLLSMPVCCPINGHSATPTPTADLHGLAVDNGDVSHTPGDFLTGNCIAIFVPVGTPTHKHQLDFSLFCRSWG